MSFTENLIDIESFHTIACRNSEALGEASGTKTEILEGTSSFTTWWPGRGIYSLEFYTYRSQTIACNKGYCYFNCEAFNKGYSRRLLWLTFWADSSPSDSFATFAYSKTDYLSILICRWKENEHISPAAHHSFWEGKGRQE